MIFLLNKEYVVWEVVELARLHMCEILRVSPSEIDAKIELASAKLSPEFNVNADACKGLPVDQIREVMAEVYKECKEEMKVRLYGVDRVRDDVIAELRCESKETTSPDSRD